MTDKFRNIYRIPSARFRHWDYSSNGIYFITICTAGHYNYLGEITNDKILLSQIGELVKKEWLRSFEIRAELFCDTFVIMPNHIHAILQIDASCSKFKNHYMDQPSQTEVTHTPTVETHRQDVEIHCKDEEIHGQDVETHGRASLPIKSIRFGVAYRPPKSISSFIAGFKSAVTVNARHINSGFAWQTRFHDHIIRDDQEHYKIACYIKNNPANWDKDELFPG